MMVDLSLMVPGDNPEAAAEVTRILALAGYHCTVRHATTRDSFEAALAWSPASIHKEDRWRTMIDRLPLACLLSDADWRYTHWNPPAERIFGFRISDVLGKHPFETIVPPESEPLVHAIFGRLAAGDMSAHGTCTNRTRDGRTIFCSWHNTPLLDDEGKFLGLMSLAEDITERQLVEETRAKLQHALEEMNGELESVLYVTSHDLRSPLLNILGFSGELSRHCQQLQETLKSEFPAAFAGRSTRLALEREIPEALHFIHASANKMDGLLTGLLRLSRLGRQPLVTVELNMNRLLAQVLETMKFQVVSSRTEVEIDDLPPCRGDATQINQLFTNLLDNALKYLRPAG